MDGIEVNYKNHLNDSLSLLDEFINQCVETIEKKGGDELIQILKSPSASDAGARSSGRVIINNQ